MTTASVVSPVPLSHILTATNTHRSHLLDSLLHVAWVHWHIALHVLHVLRQVGGLQGLSGVLGVVLVCL